MRPNPMMRTVFPDSSIGRTLWRSVPFAFHQAVHRNVLLRQRDHQVERLLGHAGGVGGAHDHQRHAAGGQGGDFNRVETDADARDDLHGGGRIHLGLLERRAGQCDAHAIGQLRQQIGLADAGGVDDRFDVFAGADDIDTLLVHRVGQHHLTFVGGHGVSFGFVALRLSLGLASAPDLPGS